MSNWWKKEKTEIPYNSRTFIKILEFYLFNCPAEIERGSKKNNNLKHTSVSCRGISLRRRGWVGSKLNTLLANMKHTHTKQLSYEACSAGSDIEATVRLIEKNSSLSDKNFEMIIIAKRSDMNITASIFYYIRNAFAHGSFSVNDSIYCFESSKKEMVRAQIRLHEKTLLNWIELFNGEFDSVKTNKKNQRKKKVA